MCLDISVCLLPIFHALPVSTYDVQALYLTQCGNIYFKLNPNFLSCQMNRATTQSLQVLATVKVPPGWESL